MRQRSFLIPLLLALLASCGGDSSSTTTTVEVTGTETCSYVGVAEEGLTEFHCEEVASDPRVSGQGVVFLDWDRTSGAMSGTLEIVNDEGSWIGPFTGLDDGTHQPYVDALLEGREAYDGLQYRFHLEGAEVEGGQSQVTGTIEARS